MSSRRKTLRFFSEPENCKSDPVQILEQTYPYSEQKQNGKWSIYHRLKVFKRKRKIADASNKVSASKSEPDLSVIGRHLPLRTRFKSNAIHHSKDGRVVLLMARIKDKMKEMEVDVEKARPRVVLAHNLVVLKTMVEKLDDCIQQGEEHSTLANGHGKKDIECVEELHKVDKEVQACLESPNKKEEGNNNNNANLISALLKEEQEEHYIGSKVRRACYYGSIVVLKENYVSDEQDSKEAKLLSKLNHPNVVRALFSFVDTSNKTSTLVLENSSWGSLRNLLKNEKVREKFKIDQILRIAQDILAALVYLHEGQNIAHLNIDSSSHILIDDGPKAKLCSFSQASLIGSLIKSIEFEHNSLSAPELLQCEVIEVQGSADIFNFAHVLYELLDEPLNNKKDSGATTDSSYCKKPTLQYTFDLRIPGINAFISSCWNLKPKLRPNAIMALNDLKALERESKRRRESNVSLIMPRGSQGSIGALIDNSFNSEEIEEEQEEAVIISDLGSKKGVKTSLEKEKMVNFGMSRPKTSRGRPNSTVINGSLDINNETKDMKVDNKKNNIDNNDDESTNNDSDTDSVLESIKGPKSSDLAKKRTEERRRLQRIFSISDANNNNTMDKVRRIRRSWEQKEEEKRRIRRMFSVDALQINKKEEDTEVRKAHSFIEGKLSHGFELEEKNEECEEHRINENEDGTEKDDNDGNNTDDNDSNERNEDSEDNSGNDRSEDNSRNDDCSNDDEEGIKEVSDDSNSNNTNDHSDEEDDEHKSDDSNNTDEQFQQLGVNSGNKGLNSDDDDKERNDNMRNNEEDDESKDDIESENETNNETNKDDSDCFNTDISLNQSTTKSSQYSENSEEQNSKFKENKGIVAHDCNISSAGSDTNDDNNSNESNIGARSKKSKESSASTDNDESQEKAPNEGVAADGDASGKNDNKHSNKQYHVLSMNIRSLYQHWEELKELVEELKERYQIAAVAVQEIRRRESGLNQNYNLPGFHNPWLQLRQSDSTGGALGIWINLDDELVHDPKKDRLDLENSILEINEEQLRRSEEELEAQVLCLRLPDQTLILINAYRISNSNLTRSMEKLKKVVEKARKKFKGDLLLVGDMNVNLIESSDERDQYLEFVQGTLGLTSLHEEITRPQSGTCLDHALSSNHSFTARVITENKANSVQLAEDAGSNGFSDHLPVLVTLWPVKRETDNDNNNEDKKSAKDDTEDDDKGSKKGESEEDSDEITQPFKDLNINDDNRDKNDKNESGKEEGHKEEENEILESTGSERSLEMALALDRRSKTIILSQTIALEESIESLMHADYVHEVEIFDQESNSIQEENEDQIEDEVETKVENNEESDETKEKNIEKVRHRPKRFHSLIAQPTQTSSQSTRTRVSLPSVPNFPLKKDDNFNAILNNKVDIEETLCSDLDSVTISETFQRRPSNIDLEERQEIMALFKEDEGQKFMQIMHVLENRDDLDLSQGSKSEEGQGSIEENSYRSNGCNSQGSSESDSNESIVESSDKSNKNSIFGDKKESKQVKNDKVQEDHESSVSNGHDEDSKRCKSRSSVSSLAMRCDRIEVENEALKARVHRLESITQ